MRFALNSDDRQRAAIVRSARIGGTLARLVRARLAHVLRQLPEQPGPHDLLRVRAHVVDQTERLRTELGTVFRRLLERAALIEYRKTAIDLTRAVNRQREAAESVRDAATVDIRVDENWRDWLRLIVPAPAFDFLERIVGPLWQRVLGAIDPERAGNTVLQGIAAGKDRRQIAADLTQVFDGAAVAARRVARTAGLQVATQSQLDVSEQIPDLVIGYELNTVLDDRVRPEHRAAHGRRFYRNPRRGQRPLSDCPQPPIWNNEVAWNCRCYLTPIIQIDGDVIS